ncbi:MAG: hypothetical protein ACUVXI_01330 [bacterium]
MSRRDDMWDPDAFYWYIRRRRRRRRGRPSLEDYISRVEGIQKIEGQIQEIMGSGGREALARTLCGGCEYGRITRVPHPHQGEGGIAYGVYCENFRAFLRPQRIPNYCEEARMRPGLEHRNRRPNADSE